MSNDDYKDRWFVGPIQEPYEAFVATTMTSAQKHSCRQSLGDLWGGTLWSTVNRC